MKKIYENLDPESVIKTTDDFTEYITNNFVPKEMRNKVEHDLSNIIMDTFDEFTEIEDEDPTEDEIIQNLKQREIEGDIPMKELFNIDIKSVIDSIVREKLFEASVPLGPNERPIDDQNNQLKNDKMKNDFDEFSADDLNGPDPLAMKPEEVTLINAIEEYANQTGKQMHIKEFKDIILGILHEFDSAEKIIQLKRFVGTLANATTNLREPEEPEEFEEEMDFGDQDNLDMPEEQNQKLDQEIPQEQAPNDQEQNPEMDQKIQNKKSQLQR